MEPQCEMLMPFDPSILAEIERDLQILEIDDIKRRLNPSTVGMALRTPIFDAGTFLYRARKLDDTFNKSIPMPQSSLIYPPASRARLGRLNRPGQAVFYCSVHKESVFFEVQDLKPGDEVILTFWKSSSRMLVNNVGYTEVVFRELGATRNVPDWRPSGPGVGVGDREEMVLDQFSPDDLDAIIAGDPNSALRESLSRHFMRQVDPGNEALYKLTTAIGELHLGDVISGGLQFAGLIYPSVRMWANGDNIALQPWFVDQHLRLRKAVHYQIIDRSDRKISIRALDHASAFDTDGNLVWLGRIPVWQLGPGHGARVTLEAGVDQDGDYGISSNGVPCHWMAVDVNTGASLDRS